MDNEINILIADDHFLIAKLIKMMLVTSNRLFKVSLAKNSVEIFDYLQSNSLDLLMLDIDMPEIDGIQILKRMKTDFPNIKVLMISNHTESWIIKRSLKFGANGYICKYADSDEIISAINAIMGNEIFLCKSTIKALYTSSHSENDEPAKTHIIHTLGSLSKRELEIMKLVIEEYSTKEIAELLFISTRTVETHRKNILGKLGVKNSLGLIKLFVESNIIDSISVT